MFSDVDCLIRKGEGYEEVGKFSQAEESYRKAIESLLSQGKSHLSIAELRQKDNLGYCLDLDYKRQDSDEVRKRCIKAATAMSALGHVNYLKKEERRKTTIWDDSGKPEEHGEREVSGVYSLMPDALDALQFSYDVAAVAHDPLLKAASGYYLGLLHYAEGRWRKAHYRFSDALQNARMKKNRLLEVMIKISYANLLSNQGFQNIIKSQTPSENCREHSCMARNGKRLLDYLGRQVDELQVGDFHKVKLLLALGQIAVNMAEMASAHSDEKEQLDKLALAVLKKSFYLADAERRPALRSQAAEYLAKVYQHGETQNGLERMDNALAWLDKAVLDAQQTEAPLSLARLELLRANILRQSAHYTAALQAYQAAEQHLDRIADKLPIYLHDNQAVVKQLVDPIFRGQADILLRYASKDFGIDAINNEKDPDNKSTPEAQQSFLRGAIEAMDKIKKTELEAYTSEVCKLGDKDYIDLLNGGVSETDGGLPGNAVIFYPIVLADRIEVLLVSNKDSQLKIHRASPYAKAGFAEVEQRAHEFGKLMIDGSGVPIKRDMDNSFDMCVKEGGVSGMCGVYRKKPESLGKGGFGDTGFSKKETHEERRNRIEKGINGILVEMSKWLLINASKPGEAGGLLQSRDVSTIVYIPDSAVRKIPFSALYYGGEPDDNHANYMITRYDVITLPIVKIRRFSPQISGSHRMLMAGMAAPPQEKINYLLEDRPDYLLDDDFTTLRSCYDSNDDIKKLVNKCMLKASSLPDVSDELCYLDSLTKDTMILRDGGFTKKEFKRQLYSGGFSMLHIASHGELGKSMEDSHIMTADRENMTLLDFQRILNGAALQQHPLDLLTLNACDTIRENVYAMLGFGSISLRSNVRSVVGTLYTVKDDVAGKFSEFFYGALSKEPSSRPAAFRAALRSLIAYKENEGDPTSNSCVKSKVYDFSHPIFWAPFVYVGHWK